MSDTKVDNIKVVNESDAVSSTQADEQIVVFPQSWRYKRIGPLPYYASPLGQLLLVSFVCFLCPGMFNALSGMGGGGQIDQRPNDASNIALYSTFAVFGFFAGSFANVMGLRMTLGIGGIGYCIYVASYLSYSHSQNFGFTVFAGAFLGVCAAFLWTAQGAIMMSYPTEAQKGRYISYFWMIFNLGAVIGALIPLGQNFHATSKVTVSDGTYIGFIVLTLCGAFLALTLCSAKSVIREDGSKVILMKHPSWKTELWGLYETLQSDAYIIFMFPMFFASNFFYGYQFNAVNGSKFNTRTAALNNVLYWTMQIIGASIFGYALDYQGIRRSIKARILWVVLMVLTMTIWGGGYAFQKTYTREQQKVTDENPHPPVFDWTSPGYIGPMFLYMFYGFYDAAFQTCVYWYMGSMTNNSRKLANFTGFYKGIQSAGAAVIWALDRKVSYMRILAACWGLLAGSLIIGLPLIWFKIPDHVSIEADLRFSDETVEDVAPAVVTHHA